jgi:hypothetical protein
MLNKEYSYTSTSPLGLHELFYGELYLFIYYLLYTVPIYSGYTLHNYLGM